LLIISVIVGLIYFAYWLPKRLGKRKLGLWLSGALTIGVSVIILATVFEDQLFFKSDVTKRLSEHDIELKYDFRLNSNEIYGLRDYYHQFELTISPEDKERLKTKILTADNYQDDAEEMFDLRQGKPRYSDNDTAFIANYQDKGIIYTSFINQISKVTNRFETGFQFQKQKTS